MPLKLLKQEHLQIDIRLSACHTVTSYQFKASQREVPQCSTVKKLVLFFQVVDGDGVVQCDGLTLLNVAQG